jgi:putative transposase
LAHGAASCLLRYSLAGSLLHQLRNAIGNGARRGVWQADEAILRYGRPEIMNTNQGSQFTSSEFINVLQSNAIAISMDGGGCWRDNVFVERLWKSIKYEEVYLRAYESVSEAKLHLGRYLTFYNERRPHSSLDGRTPDYLY